MKKVFIIHYYAIAYFPPAFNMLRSLMQMCNVTCISSSVDNFSIGEDMKGYVRSPIHTCHSDSRVLTLFKYLYFLIYTLFELLKDKPDTIIYYESISALPVYIYKRFINRRVKVAIHYHEYMTREEYEQPGMRLSAFNNSIEVKYLYNKACWISHTNKYRIDFFLKDYPLVEPSKCYTLPNYPPKDWFVPRKENRGDGVTKLVYVGSLSRNNMYLEELCYWIDAQQGRYTIDFHSFNFHKPVVELIEKIDSPYITIYPRGVAYDDMPNVLSAYDVGLILYKATELNFKYNETNKLYEYLICGLDVWFSSTMTLIDELDKTKFAPNVVSVDFEHMDQFTPPQMERVVDNSSYPLFAEDVYNKFYLDIADGRY